MNGEGEGREQPIFFQVREGTKDVSTVKPPSVSPQSRSLFGELLTVIMAPFA